MPSTSQTILGSTAHPNGGTTTTVVGDKYKADGYYGFTDGLHTVAIYPNNFKGNVEIQASLAETPTSSDWFNITLKNGTVAQYNLDGTVDAYTFTGNFIYLRARVTPEATNIGSVDKILLNY